MTDEGKIITLWEAIYFIDHCDCFKNRKEHTIGELRKIISDFESKEIVNNE